MDDHVEESVESDSIDGLKIGTAAGASKAADSLERDIMGVTYFVCPVDGCSNKYRYRNGQQLSFCP